jgi:hypothetical protein
MGLWLRCRLKFGIVLIAKNRVKVRVLLWQIIGLMIARRCRTWVGPTLGWSPPVSRAIGVVKALIKVVDAHRLPS